MKYKEAKQLLRSYYRYYYLITNNADDLLIDFEKNILKSKINNLNKNDQIKILEQVEVYIKNQNLLQEIADEAFEKQLKINNNY